MKTLRLFGVAGLSFLALATGAGFASAAPLHPRRAEVSHRLEDQNHRIRHAVRVGRITPHEARRLRREDHRIRHEQRFMARLRHGSISRAEQKALNQQENKVSRRIAR